MFLNSESENVDLVDLAQETELLYALNTIRFGPCNITIQAWKSLKLAVKALSAQRNARKVIFALLGQLQGKKFVIKDIVQLVNESLKQDISWKDVKRIEREANKEKLLLIGILHAHSGETPIASSNKKVMWLSSMFEFNRPLLYFVLAADSLRLAAFSISPQTFYQLKEAIKFIPFEVKE